MINKLFKSIVIILGGGFLLLLVPVLVYLFIFQPFHVRDSFEPYYPKGAYVTANKLSYRSADPQKEDVVLFKSPRDQSVDEIGVVTNIPGETVSLGETTFELDSKSYLVTTNSLANPVEVVMKNDLIGKVAFCYSGCNK